MILIPTKKMYSVLYQQTPIQFEGNIVVCDNIAELIFGNIYLDKEIIGIVNQEYPYYKIYNSDYKQEILNLINSIKQNLKNLGYVVNE